MKTKILSVLLACLMLLSVFPVAVFADAHSHAATCPGKGVDHTPENCGSATQVGDRVLGYCTGWSYDLMKCDTCGDYFADNLERNASEHNWEEIAKEVPAQCKEDGTLIDGKKAVEKCTACGLTRGGETIVAKHNDKEIDRTGSCTEAGYIFYKCEDCGYEHQVPVNPGDGHAWELIPEIITEPICGTVNGVARFECTAPDCGETKDVTIFAAHVMADLKYHAPAAPTCTVAGSYEYWECEICGVCYTNVASKTELAKDSKGNYITAIPALGHTNPAVDAAGELVDFTIIKDYVAPTCEDKGSYVFVCSVCGEDVPETLKELGHQYDEGKPIVEQAPTCTEFGVKVWACLRENCGKHSDTEITKPTGHTKYDDATSNQITDTPPTCEQAGYYEWECGNCGETQTSTPAATGHSSNGKGTKRVVAASCVQYAYTYYYCTNQNCNLTLVSSLVVDSVEYDVTVGGNPVRVIGNITVNVAGGYNTDPSHITVEDNYTVVQPATCDKAGVGVYLCKACNEHKSVEIPKLSIEDHKDANLVVDTTAGVLGIVAPTCNDGGYTVYKCKHDCGYTKNLNPTNALGHKYGEEQTTPATCIADGEIYRLCEQCDATTEGHKTVVKTLTYEPEVEYSMESVAEKHPNATKVENYLDGDCLNKGLYKYYCKDCGENLLVHIPGTGKGHLTPDGYKVTEPTCTVDGLAPAYTCARPECGANVSEKHLPATGHPKADLDKAPNCIAAVICSKCSMELHAQLPHDWQPKEGQKATCKDDGYTAYEQCANCPAVQNKTVLPALNHKNLAILTVKNVGCENFGFTHYFCPDCKGDANGDLVFGDVEAEYIVDYKPAKGHAMEKSDTLSVAPQCGVGGEDVEVCANGCGKTVRTPLPALKHANVGGKEIVDDCLDTVEDRFCVNCNQTIGKTCQVFANVIIDPKCEVDGYILDVCVKCQNSTIKDVILATGHKAGAWTTTKNPTFTSEGWEKQYCANKGCNMLMNERAIPALPGVVYNLSADNAIVNGANYADSSLVAVKVSLDSIKLDVQSVMIDVVYDASVVTFEGYEFLSADFVAVQTCSDNGGLVTLYAQTNNTLDGKLQNTTIEGEQDFAVLYFRIDNKKATAATFSVANGSTVEYVEGQLGGKAHSDDETAVETIAIGQFMDLTGDKTINNQDAMALYQIITGELGLTYDARADIDKSGVVDYHDLELLAAYMTSQTEENYENMVDARPLTDA